MGDRDERLKAAFEPFGLTCTEEFWRKYDNDPWIFNLANAVERLSAEVVRLRSEGQKFHDAWWTAEGTIVKLRNDLDRALGEFDENPT